MSSGGEREPDYHYATSERYVVGTPRIASDYTNRANYQSQYAKNNREAINARKREWRKRTGKH